MTIYITDNKTIIMEQLFTLCPTCGHIYNSDECPNCEESNDDEDD